MVCPLLLRITVVTAEVLKIVEHRDGLFRLLIIIVVKHVQETTLFFLFELLPATKVPRTEFFPRLQVAGHEFCPLLILLELLFELLVFLRELLDGGGEASQMRHVTHLDTVLSRAEAKLFLTQAHLNNELCKRCREEDVDQ